MIAFRAVGVPWLQPGDRISVIESSAYGEEYTEPIYGEQVEGTGLMYTIVDLQFDQGNTLEMSGTAFFQGYVTMPLPEEEGE